MDESSFGFSAVEIGLLHFSLGCTLSLLITEIFRGDRWLVPANDSESCRVATSRLRGRWNRVRWIQAALAVMPLLVVWWQSLVSANGFNPSSARWLTSAILIPLAIFTLQTIGIPRFGSEFQAVETGPSRLARFFAIGLLSMAAASTAIWLCGVGPAASSLNAWAGVDAIISATLLAAALSAACGVVELSESDPVEIRVLPWPWREWAVVAGLAWLPQILMSTWRIGFGPKIENFDALMILLVFLLGRLVAGAISWQANQSLAKLESSEAEPVRPKSKKKKEKELTTPRSRTIVRITTMIAAMVAVLCHAIAGSIAHTVLWP